MEKREFTIQSECDGLTLGVTMYIPDEIKGILQIAHGMAEHRERYDEFMEYMAECGYVTIIHDHRGHGESVKVQDDLGYFYEKRAEFIVEDIHQITRYVRELYLGVPVTLFGHSMGSMVVRKYLKKYDAEIDKLIVCGSPSQNPMAGMGILLARTLEIFKGEKHRSNLIQGIALGAYSKNFATEHSQSAWICSDSEIVKAYDEHPLCGYIFTLNGFQNLFCLMRDIYQRKGWEMQNRELPILFIAGSEDPVIVSEKKWWESQEFLRQLGYVNVTGKLYGGLRHEILNEKCRKDVYEDIVYFMK